MFITKINFQIFIKSERGELLGDIYIGYRK